MPVYNIYIHIYICTYINISLPLWLRCESICLHCGRPWVRKILWRRKWQPTPVLLPGKSHGRRSLVGSMGSQRVRHDWATSLRFTSHICMFNWSIVDLQCCVSFWCTTKSLSYTYNFPVLYSRTSLFIYAPMYFLKIAFISVFPLAERNSWVNSIDRLYLLFNFFASLRGMQFPYSPTRDPTCGPCRGSALLTIGPPGSPTPVCFGCRSFLSIQDPVNFLSVHCETPDVFQPALSPASSAYSNILLALPRNLKPWLKSLTF